MILDCEVSYLLYPVLISTFFKSYRPKTKQLLELYKHQAEQITDPILRKEAIASLEAKSFHCYGASFYASLVLPEKQMDYLKFMTAYQTMCDYLDNLVDQTKVINETNFRRLHQALLDVFKVNDPISNYYQYQTQQLDGGYLVGLVRMCRKCLHEIPHYHQYATWLLKLATLYVDLQVYKHLHPNEREIKLKQLAATQKRLRGDLTWYEFSAACGSTLGIFSMVAYGMGQQKYHVPPEIIFNSHFTYVQQLHIMMDYLIDLNEDIRDGELNFFSYYNSYDEGLESILSMYQKAQCSVESLPEVSFHQTINDGLFALYLAEGIKKEPKLKSVQKRLLKPLGFRGRFLYHQATKFVR